ncbi:AraC family transcriptional regulator [Sphingobacterium corticibacter]|uniref:AraC family transcriptional regulator n=1 Tax=Sphingobacterium corticibacter TaxID=2171749 RepID=A0A2T8HF79_9SPHI|nr:helix-turn-helix domain-containing protein [Sphingobacterium corticibacter]PVH24064.1 AraC family transcriptional regulator [Sphingobacterium corticibacter]
MIYNYALDVLPLSTDKQLSTLVENRRVATFESFEFNVFETYQPTLAVPLQFDDVVMVNMLRGKKVMHLENTPSFDYVPGETLILPENKLMKIDFPEANVSAPTQCAALTIDRRKVEGVVQFLNERLPSSDHSAEWHFRWDKFHFKHDAETMYLTNKLFRLMSGNDCFHEALAELTIQELLIRTLQTQNLLHLMTEEGKKTSLLNYLTEFIREHISSELTIDLLSKKANMSRSALFKEFKSQVGISPMEYVIRERIAFAKRFLEQGLSVKEAGYAVGFNDVNYFVRLFGRREGLTPGAYAHKMVMGQ